MASSSNQSTPPLNLWHPRYWLGWFGMGIMWLLTQLPHSLRLRIGALLGALAYHLIPKRKKIAAENISRCFPELSSDQQDRLVHEHFSALGMGVMEVTTSWWASDQAVAKLIRFKGIEYAEEALKQGRGVIMLCAHFTSLNLGGRGVSQRLKMDITYRHMNNPVSNAVIRRATIKHHGVSIHREDVKGLIRQLKNNRPVWFAPDQKFRGKASVKADFFGVPAPTNPAVARLAKITGAAVVPHFSKRLPDGTYEVIFFPPLEDFPSGDLVKDTQAMNDIFEKMIRMAPEQYFWVHNRFG
jgi:KDO2-lipid IV(A) lauroyltransferase